MRKERSGSEKDPLFPFSGNIVTSFRREGLVKCSCGNGTFEKNLLHRDRDRERIRNRVRENVPYREQISAARQNCLTAFSVFAK